MRLSGWFLLALLLLVGPALAAEETVAESDPLDWPREYTAPDGSRLELYRPQLVSWDDWERLEARAAIAVQRQGETEPRLGIVRLVATTEVSVRERLVRMTEVDLLEVRFADGEKSGIDEDDQALLDLVLPAEHVVSLDDVLADLERSGVRQQTPQIKAEPPPIFVSTSAAVLVMLDGEPVWADVGKGKLQYAINTNWDLFREVETSGHYLRVEDGWLTTEDLDGAWKVVDKLPKAFKKIPKNDENFAQVRAAVPGKRILSTDKPRVYVTNEPAELIVIDSRPKLQPIAESDLLWVTNTDSDLFVFEGGYYYLVAGRWFRAEDLDGSWSFATAELPAAFREIPPDHPRSRVLSSVPGTQEAEEAIILAQIPHKATVDRDDLEAPEVFYSTDQPQFESIEGTEVKRATNTPYQVLETSGRYYLCHDAVWFAAPAPIGPWVVADSVPVEIYTIPASSPAHPVTYVEVYTSTPTTVTVGYTSGYGGVYVGWGVAVYGTGWYYPPYSYYGPYYPHPMYYGYPTSYGAAAWYNPNTGTYGRSAVAYGPYGGMGRSAAYNPQTGTYARSAAAYGPYNARGWAEAYNPSTGTYAQTRQGANVYGNWGATSVRQGDDWVRSAHAAGSEGAIAGYRTSEGGGGFVATDNESLYAGRDGNVYKRDDSGWNKYDNGDWSSVERPDSAQPREGSRRSTTTSVDRSTYDQLSRDAYSRDRGSSNRSRSQSWSGGGSYGGRGGGSYGGRSGGASRGGRRR